MSQHHQPSGFPWYELYRLVNNFLYLVGVHYLQNSSKMRLRILSIVLEELLEFLDLLNKLNYYY